MAEACNSIVNKLNSGKQVNHCAKDSFQVRCYGAVAQYNTMGVLSQIHNKISGTIPTSILRMEKNRQLQAKRTRLFRQAKGIRRHRTWHGPNKDYGPSAEKPDLLKDVYDVLVQKHFEKLKENQRNQIRIERDTVSQSDCDMWHQLRTDIITASKFGSICRMLKTTSCANMVLSIRYPKVLNTVATHYGIANEGYSITEG
ncbi:unnamed protein product [Lasius platythorax]|uniref:Uncharacterized protein n=1 Tax=Lasius platythorax TaxID=488582 RepID=A0AAV2MZ99_9HYME